MTVEPRLALISGLQQKVHACLAEFVDDKPFALVDFPNIRNVGDSAIWQGEIAYFADRHGKKPGYVSEVLDYTDEGLEASVGDGTIFVHGGGNFGDIWVSHQDFRERLLARWPGRPIVQLPQSIHYGSAERIDVTARAIEKHGNFTLLVRDVESRDFSEKHFNCRVILCPDMAVCIGPVATTKPVFPLLAMLRQDKEKAADYDMSRYPSIPVEDWIKEPWFPVRAAKGFGVLSALATFDIIKMRRSEFNGAARQRFGRGIRQISRAQAIVTDRLHVHILSMLIGRPHAVLDNSYGKIARFMEAFSGGLDLTYRAQNIDDAIEWAQSRVGQLG